MSTSNVITLFSVPQTPSPDLPKTMPERYDAILLGITGGIQKKDRISKEGQPAPDRWEIAYDALVAFLDDPAKHDYVILREVALALAKMIARKPNPNDLSWSVANAVIDLAYKDDMPPELDWPGRKRQCCDTSQIMDSVVRAADVQRAKDARSRP
jgi:hypothetical protein